uniref:hypothetical protein n=1 Tax=Paenarthrobacter nicotinovorans TaxID=29320 RepID=UPI003F495B02
MIRPLPPLRWLRSAAVAIVLASAALLPAAGAAVAADDSNITWSVRPADTTGPDNRSWVEQEIDPGKSVQDHLAVRNLGKEKVTFRLGAADGYITPGGRFNMLPSDTESIHAGTWIKVPDTVTVEAGATVVVPFTTTVPASAEPGDHAAGIAASLILQKTGEAGTAVGVESRIGFRVMTRVTGELSPRLELQNVKATYDVTWNPFQPGQLNVSAEAVNAGNARLQITGSAESQGHTSPSGATSPDQEILPGERRPVTVELNDIWPTFVVGANLTISPTMLTIDGSRSELGSVTTSTSAGAFPTPQLLVLTGAGLFAFAIIGGRAKSRRRTAALIDAARKEGRQEAKAEHG